MAKKKKTKEVPDQENQKPLDFKSATIADDFLNYQYKVNKGVDKGFTHNIKGIGIVDQDLLTAFESFHRHMAFSDDVFKHSGIEVTNIDDFDNHELTNLFVCTGFQIKGTPENESVILIGNKYTSALGARLEWKSSKIDIGDLSPYPWHNELKAAVDIARHEVELYNGGKYTLPETEVEEEVDKNQTNLMDTISDLEKAGGKVSMSFENAKVD